MKFIFLYIILTYHLAFSQNFYPEVNYKIDAELFPESKKLNVKSLMTYKNNAPDELNEIYIHIYWNIYSKNSYARKLAEKNKVFYTQQNSDVEIKQVILHQNEKRQENVYQIDNTVMRIPLINPLKTGESIQIEIELEEEVPPEGLRMGYYKRYFSIAHWFPSVCVYDKYGWHKDQYLGTGEFYEEISDFDVSLTLPETFLVFYTGLLQNPKEVYTQEILRKLEEAKKSDSSVRIFEPPDKIHINDEKKKTWKIKAQNVRTFAFACYEDYLWDASSIDGILVSTVYPKSLENFYKEEGMKAARHAIKFFSEKIGPYVYPQMFVTVGGTTGGMEYPGIVFMGRGQIGGTMAKNTAAVIIHEIGHNWFPMMLNSNEIDFAFMDEGFNTFITNLAVEELYGRKNNKFNFEGFLAKLFENTDVRSSDYFDVIRYQKSGLTEPIITHSDRYEQSSAYIVNSYPRTSMNLFMLQYVMGDKAFEKLWKEYYKRFLFKKIYPEDFFILAEEIYQEQTGRKALKWFFDEWFNKDYSLDFAIEKFKVKSTKDGYQTEIEVCNKGRALMPCDVEVQFDDGSKTYIYFDVEDFSKGVQLASKTFLFEKKPVKTEINPDKRLLDINRLNNTSSIFHSAVIKFKPLLDLSTDPFNYRIYYSPYLWFNNYDGFKFGLNLEGNYLVDEKKFKLSLFKGLRRGVNSLGGEILVGDKLDFLGPLTSGTFKFFNFEGRRGLKFLISKKFVKYSGRNPQFKIDLSASYFDAFDDVYFNKLKYDQELVILGSDGIMTKIFQQRKFLYSAVDLVYTNSWKYFRTKFNVYLESGVVKEIEQNWFYDAILGTSNKISNSWQNLLYQKLSFTFVQDFRPEKIFTYIKLRQYLGLTPKKLPKAREFNLATVNPIDEFDLSLYRTYGIFSKNFIENHAIPIGEGMMRGFFKNNISDDLITTFNGEIDFSRIFSNLGLFGQVIYFLNPKFFFDFGNVWANEKQFKIEAIKYDWGFSLSFIPNMEPHVAEQIQQFNPFTNLGINDLRIDFPLFVSHPPNAEKKFQFRWVLGLRGVF